MIILDSLHKVSNNDRQQRKLRKIGVNVAHKRLGHVNKHQARLTYKKANHQVIGNMKACKACLLCKGKQNPMRKITWLRAGMPGEHLFINSTGPFSTAHGGTQYWVQVVDDKTRIGFCYFLKVKSNIAIGLERLLHGIQKYGYSVKYI